MNTRSIHRALTSLELCGATLATGAAETPLERGRHLMQSIVACGNCHTPQGPNGPIAGMELAGALRFEEPPFSAVATKITPTNLARYSDAALKAVIATGVRPDGSRLKPPMGTDYCAKLTPADLDAVVAYLRSLPPK